MPCRNKADIRSVPQKVAKCTNLALSELFIRQPVCHQQHLSLKSASLWSFQFLTLSLVRLDSAHSMDKSLLYVCSQKYVFSSRSCSWMFELHCAEWCVCRVWNYKAVFTFTAESRNVFSVFSEKTDFNEGRPRALRHHTQFGSQSWSSIRIHKCAVVNLEPPVVSSSQTICISYILEF